MSRRARSHTPGPSESLGPTRVRIVKQVAAPVHEVARVELLEVVRRVIPRQGDTFLPGPGMNEPNLVATDLEPVAMAAGGPAEAALEARRVVAEILVRSIPAHLLAHVALLSSRWSSSQEHRGHVPMNVKARAVTVLGVFGARCGRRARCGPAAPSGSGTVTPSSHPHAPPEMSGPISCGPTGPSVAQTQRVERHWR
jgi:hypothetical protein